MDVTRLLPSSGSDLSFPYAAQPLSSHSSYIADHILRLPRGGAISSWAQLYISFSISAFVHFGGEYAMHNHSSGGALKFFLSQAVVISVEDVVTRLWERMDFGRPRFARVFGYAWVCFWFTYSLPAYADSMLRAGIPHGTRTISPILGLWKGEWFP